MGGPPRNNEPPFARQKAEGLLAQAKERGELDGKEGMEVSVDPVTELVIVCCRSTIINVMDCRVREATKGKLEENAYKRYFSGTIQNGSTQLLSWPELREARARDFQEAKKAYEEGRS